MHQSKQVKEISDRTFAFLFADVVIPQPHHEWQQFQVHPWKKQLFPKLSAQC